jgi:hypothetical protein
LWGIGFWTPELIRGFKNSSAADRNWYVAWARYCRIPERSSACTFTMLTVKVGRRPATSGVPARARGHVFTFGRLHQANDILWMIPLLGFCNLMVFGGFSIYFPECIRRGCAARAGFCYNVGRVIAALGPSAGKSHGGF